MTPQQAKEHTRAARLSWRIDNLVDFIDERIPGVDENACLQELVMLLEEIDELEPLASVQWRGVEGMRSMCYPSIAFYIFQEYERRAKACKEGRAFDESRLRRLQRDYPLGIEIDGRIMDEA